MKDSNSQELFTIHSVLLESSRVVLERRLGKYMLRNMELRERRDIIDDLVITLSSEVLSTKLCEDSYEVSDVQTYHFPKGPWQHFKHNYMPMWFCDIFPIKYSVKRIYFHKTIKITRRETYPMCNMDVRNNPTLCVQLGKPVIKDEVKIS
ncbi:hypothetical protein LRM41_02060 [Candidatus Nanosynbacter sp. TM7-087]|uniref:hypothetical protein n=1 Tax=Candidatus Nanosynbacter sp. TM7-087 TaxID=2902631 RepID=UPI001FB5898A|nr:hypothetical protein [Candidatus Nanosynbacter sp. TM7-087]MCJ1966347.1 hypothetical protein [Candidatus Nanosynbacter sp. TM7-087]